MSIRFFLSEKHDLCTLSKKKDRKISSRCFLSKRYVYPRSGICICHVSLSLSCLLPVVFLENGKRGVDRGNTTPLAPLVNHMLCISQKKEEKRRRSKKRGRRVGGKHGLYPIESLFMPCHAMPCHAHATSVLPCSSLDVHITTPARLPWLCPFSSSS